METIKLDDMARTIDGVKFTSQRKVSKDATGKANGEHKLVNVTIDFSGAALEDVFQKATSQAVIRWQNGVARKTYTTLPNDVTIKFERPARTAKTPEQKLNESVDVFGSLTPEQQKAYIEKLMDISK